MTVQDCFLLYNLLIFSSYYIIPSTCTHHHHRYSETGEHSLPTTMDNAWHAYSLEELEKQMSPSRWNPTKSPDQVIQDYISDSIKGTEEARKSIPNKLNISYGQLDSQKYDLYGSDLKSDATILVWIHGGYWQEGSKDISGLFAPLNYKAGLRTIVLGYTLAPTAKIEQMFQELISALVQLTTSHPNAKLIVGGHSAGAQLAAYLLHSNKVPTPVSNALRGLILVSGVYNLEPLVPTYVNEPLKMDADEAASLSPLTLDFNNLINFNHLKTLVLVGGYDSPEFQRQSKVYVDKLKKKGVDTSFVKVDSDDHFTIVTNLAVPSSDSYKALEATLGSFTNIGSSSGGGIGTTATILTLLALIITML